MEENTQAAEYGLHHFTETDGVPEGGETELLLEPSAPLGANTEQIDLTGEVTEELEGEEGEAYEDVTSSAYEDLEKVELDEYIEADLETASD